MKTSSCLCLVVLLLLSLTGCATHHPFMGLPAVPAYQPGNKPVNIDNAGRAKLAMQELINLNPGIKIYQIPGTNSFSLRDKLISLINEGNDPFQFNYNKKDELIYLLLPKVRLLDDRLVLSSKVSLKFGDMIHAAIMAERVSEEDAILGAIVRPTSNNKMDWTKRFYRVRVTGWADFVFEKYEDAVRCAENLYVIQQTHKHISDDQAATFAAQAAQYRVLAVKPQVSEEQRRLIVQANALTQQKNYLEAIEQYDKAIKFDPTSYPAAYFNLALLLAQENRPIAAVFNMKRYLMLAPDAKDARAAQDKIYEWEMLYQRK